MKTRKSSSQLLISFAMSLAIFVGIILISSCSDSSKSSVTPDPTGTVSSALRIQGQGAFLIDFDTGAITTTNNANAPDMYLDTNVNFNAGVTSAPATARKIADVGAVGGLGDVKTIPTAGLVTAVSAMVGHGYVLEDNGKHWRIYVSSSITSAGSGGVIGMNIKWASL